jgi:hypothetical protein
MATISSRAKPRSISLRQAIGTGLSGLVGLSAWQFWLGSNNAQNVKTQIQQMPFVPPISIRTASGMRVLGRNSWA